jgi:DNA-binding Lrp family transcriptional regulator
VESGRSKPEPSVQAVDVGVPRHRSSLKQARLTLLERLRDRRTEIEEAALTRVYSVSDPPSSIDPGYVEGLRAAVSAALDYGLSAVELGVERLPPVPAPLLVQARLAARNAIGLDTVLRRYVAGYTVLNDFIMQEAAEGDPLDVDTIHSIGRDQAALLDRLLAAVGDEHTREVESRLGTSEERRAERVRRLLAGEFIDTSELDYDFGAHHLGMVAAGPGVAEAIQAIGASFDCRVLLVPHGEGTVWGWLGARRSLGELELERLAAQDLPAHQSLAIGEPSQGLAGWRHTHQQALAALPIAMRSPKGPIRYADVALLALMLQDDLLANSLRELYLAPLSEERDGGTVLRETLRAYFAAERNTSSAAAVLGVSRRTVANRLRKVEERTGRPVGAILTEIDAALRLDDFGAASLVRRAVNGQP